MAVGFRVVIDTNVVFEGLTRRDSVPTLIIDAWRERVFRPCISNALGYEYVDVLSRKLSRARWHQAQPLVEELLAYSEFVPLYFSWRPSSPDPGDEHVVDCAMNASASVVTSNIRDFVWAGAQLGLQVLTPGEFLQRLTDQELSNPDQE